jgi:uncharacterized FlgJ-related protein
MNEKWINIFNSKFEEFVKDLIELYPNDKDFKILKNSFSLLKMTDMKKPFQLFLMYSVDYEDAITRRDENFFLSNNYENIAGEESNFTADLMNKLKKYWTTLSETNKETIWNYLTLFFTIKNKCI